jgi:glycosyltransferase involved in cell wall biosynthesis
MKVLFFIESLRAGGKERRIVELLKGLKQYKEIEIELVVTRKDIHYKEFFDLNIPLHVIERKFLKKDPLIFFKFYRIAKKFRPDIIHAWGHMVAFYAVPTSKMLGVPLLNNEITDATLNSKLIGKNWVFKASAKIIANTKAGLLAYHAPLEKSGVIYNGFNFDRLKKLEPVEEVRKKFNIQTTQVVAMVATFNLYKDYGTYLKGAIEVLRKSSDVTFLCVGEGDDSLFRKMVPGEFKDRILFLGKQTNVESIMNICSVGVLLTDIKYHAEGISNALLEFMALGKPVIATAFGGSLELIDDNQTGHLIEPYAVDQLADKVFSITNNEALRVQLGTNAKNKVLREFTIEKMVSSFYEEYKKLL